ncbi:hypothetical protein HK104_000859 [Borealophlyctis nickersoniae]|nr:hypothetical protein HK104_000859 [Borealophlyctis nickersoniae]
MGPARTEDSSSHNNPISTLESPLAPHTATPLSPPVTRSSFRIEKDEEVILGHEDMNGLIRLLLTEAKQSSNGKIIVRKCEELSVARKLRKVLGGGEGEEEENDEGSEADDDEDEAMFRAAPCAPPVDTFDPIKKQIAKIKKHPGTLEISLSVALSLQRISGVTDHPRLDNEVQNHNKAERMSKLYRAMTYLLYRNLWGENPTCRRWQNVKDAIGPLCVVAFWDEPGLVEMNNTQLGLLKLWWNANHAELPIYRLQRVWIQLLVAIRGKQQELIPGLLEQLRKLE